MKKINMISRIVLAVITFIVFSIIVMNEDSSWNVVPVIFSLIVFGLSFLSTKLARRIIEIGNKINNNILKVLYYIVLPIALLGLSLLIVMGMSYLGENVIPTPNDFGSALGQALMILFAMVVVVIIIVLPYVQSIIILILNKIVKGA